MVTSAKVHVPSPRVHNFKDAKIQGGERRIGPRTGGDVDVNDTQEEPSATTGKEPKTSKTGNLVLSGPNKNITDSVKKMVLSGNIQQVGLMQNSVLKGVQKPNRHHIGSITCHLMIPRHFRSTTKVTSSVTKTPTSYTSPTTRGNCQAAERHQSMNHEPGTVSCKMVEDLKKLYPNSFDRLGSLKGEYNIRVDPTVKPATHAGRKVPIESKEAIDKELAYLIEEEIIMEQVESTPWVSLVTFPMKPNGEVRVCLDPSNLNKASITNL